MIFLTHYSDFCDNTFLALVEIVLICIPELSFAELVLPFLNVLGREYCSEHP